MNRIKTLFGVAVLLVFLFFYQQAGYCSVSDKTEILYSVQEYYDIACSNDIVVAGGTNGNIVYSADGEKWTKAETAIKDKLQDVYWDGSKFFAIGFNGRILLSKNGKTWDNINSGTEEKLYSIVKGKDKYLAVGANGTIISSKDGNSWNNEKTGYLNCFNKIIWTGKNYVITGFDGIILNSQNGINWTKYKYKSEDIKNIVFDGKKYIIFTKYGGIVTTSDFKSYKECDISAKSIIYDNNKFYSLSKEGIIYESAGGKSWKERKVIYPVSQTYVYGQSVINFNSFIKFKNKYIIVGNNSMILSSTDLKSWNKHSYESTFNFDNYVTNGKVHICNSSDKIILSTDLKTWKEIDLGSYINKIIFDGKRFICICRQGGIFYSIDGYKWYKSKTGTQEDINSIVFTGEKYVCVSRELILTSDDLIKWKSTKVIDVGPIEEIKYNNHVFVCCTGDGDIITSNDGYKWSINSNYHHADSFPKIYFINGTFYVCIRRDLYYSNDGLKWERSYIDENLFITDIAYDGEATIIVTSNGRIIKSNDLITWKKVYEQKDSLNAILYDNGYLICSGDNGTLLISQNGDVWQKVETNTNDYLHTITKYNDGYLVFGSNSIIKVKKYNFEGIALNAENNNDNNLSLNINNIHITNTSIQSICKENIVLTSNDFQTDNQFYYKSFDIGINNGSKYYLYKINYVSNQYMYYSENGKDWVKKTINLPKSDYLYEAESIIFSHNKFIMVVDSWHKDHPWHAPSAEILYSMDGITWKNASIVPEKKNEGGLRPYYCVASNGKAIVAGGNAGVIGYSIDGLKWRYFYSNCYGDIIKIIWNGKKFVAVTSNMSSDNSYIIESEDGIKWTEIGKIKSASLNDIIYDGEQYLILGLEITYSKDDDEDSGGSFNSILLSSKDLNSWTITQIKNNSLVNIIKYKDNIYFNGEKPLLGTYIK